MNSLSDLLSAYLGNQPEIYTLSRQISNNIIAIAASSIFANPYNSFVELISNSIDSYNSEASIACA